MRQLLWLLLCLPLHMQAQINRSARELAMENVQAYIIEKLFTQKRYEPLSFSWPRPYKPARGYSDMCWIIGHDFNIRDSLPNAVSTQESSHHYRFYFLLDKKMRVRQAEEYSMSGDDGP